jgi:CDP-glucose 4,6-dehydratase
MNKEFWLKKRVFITGHTGFKGSWLCLWLSSLGAEVTGYALNPPSEPSLFNLCNIQELISSIKGDVRDYSFLHKSIRAAEPEIIIHMAAQSLVRDSYINPVETYAINVMGTVNILESVRYAEGVKVVINVTTDKCYENKEWLWGYRENEPLGGYDPYSNSKACSELVTASYKSSFFNPEKYDIHGIAVASARAGNVIGGGDWAKDRLIVDCINALLQGEKIRVRNPHAIRPWQHVLEPLSGYLTLSEKLYCKGVEFAEGWNFGPDESAAKSVGWIVERFCQKWPGSKGYCVEKGEHPHEANYLKLDCSKAKNRLNWYPKWNLEKTIDAILEWTVDYKDQKDPRESCLSQIAEYMRSK